jgi:phage terminase large subunit-like protein
MKGAGKNPLAAVLDAVEFIGPCRFGGFEGSKPIVIAQNSSWVQNAAVAKDQTRNTMTLFPSLFSERTKDEYSLDIGRELIYAKGGTNRLEAVTSSPSALEGGRATAIMRDETHLWMANNEGHAMAAVIERNVAKSRGGAARVLSFTNAHNPAEDSVGQRDYEAYIEIMEKRSKATGFLYDSIEAPPGTDLKDYDSLKAGILAARGDAVWLDVDRLIEEIWDPRSDPATSRRYYLNQIHAAEDAWMTPQEWDLCARPDIVVLPGDEITLAFDGSKTMDHSALVGCRVSDSHLFTLAVWDPEDYEDHEIPTEQVDQAVERAFATYLVDGFYSDVSPWESYVDKWEREYSKKLYVESGGRHVIGFDMRGRTKEITQAVEAFHDAVIERVITHEGNKRISQYVYNAKRRPNQYGVTIGKEHRMSPRKIDWAIAAVLARLARQNYLLLPPNRQRRKRSGKAMFV